MRVIELRPSGVPGAGPAFTHAAVLPDRGMMLAALRARLADGRDVAILVAPPLEELAARFGAPDDFAGNASFSFGAALLIPYANRIRGRPVDGRREIETEIAGKTLRLPMNWGGKAKGAERYAMHGLILDRAFDVTRQARDAVIGVLHAGDFGGHWLSASDVSITYRLEAAALHLSVEATNVGGEPLPIGIGWHPYFAIPSGRRAAARLHVPARERVEVDNYDTVLPTGTILSIAANYDFTAAEGRELDARFLDDCFVGLDTHRGWAEASLTDAASGIRIAVTAKAPPVTAFQIYAPPEQAFVAIEPQFNQADPYGAEWKGRDTGMVLLQPGESARYDVRVEIRAA